MKKTFLTRRNALLSPGGFSWGSSLLAIAVLLVLVRVLVPNFYLYMFAPVLGLSDNFASQSHTFFNSFENAAALASRNEQLQSENASLAAENQTLQQKNTSLLLALNATSGKAEPKQIVADVISRPPESPYDTLLVSEGARAGVTVGMLALALPHEGTTTAALPVGVVSSVVADFSRVTLFSSPGARTLAWVGEAASPITLMGAGAGAVTAVVPRALSIAVGDAVFGPGMLVIGSVTRVDSDPSSPAVVLRIAPVTSPFGITGVLLRDAGASFVASLHAATSTAL